MITPGEIRTYIQAQQENAENRPALIPPGPMVLIGSAAAVLHVGHDLRETPNDLDVVCAYEDMKEFVRLTEMRVSTIAKDKFAGRWRGRWIEFEIAWPGASASGLLEKVKADPKTTKRVVQGIEFLIPSLDWLFTLKTSHRFKKNDPHFEKTIRDYHFMRKAGAVIADAEWLAKREKETYTAKRPKLNVSKKDFFKDDNIEYVYDHDSLHRAVALGERPAYLEYIQEGEEVMCSREKWEACPMQVKMHGVLEEAYVLALERSQIPHAGKISPFASFKIALGKICTSITSGWFRAFAYEHYFSILSQFNHDYVEKFRRGVESGLVTRISKEEAS